MVNFAMCFLPLLKFFLKKGRKYNIQREHMTLDWILVKKKKTLYETYWDKWRNQTMDQITDNIRNDQLSSPYT